MPLQLRHLFTHAPSQTEQKPPPNEPRSNPTEPKSNPLEARLSVPVRYTPEMQQEWHREPFTISTDPRRLNVDTIYGFLHNDAYWALGRSREKVERSLRHSLNFGLYRDASQIGFASVVTDRATFAWLADVFVLAAFRKQGLSKWLLAVISNHDELQGLRRWVLATRDAHTLYRQFGFEPLSSPDRFMERFQP